MINWNAFSEFLKIVLQFANVVVLAYALYRFLNKPHDTLEMKQEELKKRVDKHDEDIREIKSILTEGGEEFRSQDETNGILISSVLALIEFEIQYCLMEHKTPSKELEKAKEQLHAYLAKK